MLVQQDLFAITGNYILTPIKTMGKKERGSMDCCYDLENKIVASRWADNINVTILSNQYGPEPIKIVSRYSMQQQCSIGIPHPLVVKCIIFIWEGSTK